MVVDVEYIESKSSKKHKQQCLVNYSKIITIYVKYCLDQVFLMRTNNRLFEIAEKRAEII